MLIVSLNDEHVIKRLLKSDIVCFRLEHIAIVALNLWLEDYGDFIVDSNIFAGRSCATFGILESRLKTCFQLDVFFRYSFHS